MGTVGPMIGQHHQFHHYNPGKSEFGEERYFKITKRLYGELDVRLKESKFLAGTEYTIADIATWPWPGCNISNCIFGASKKFRFF